MEAYHPVDSSEMAFKLAPLRLSKRVCTWVKPVLLEPIMTLHITVPDSYTGDIMSDLNGRKRARARYEPQGNGFTVVDAQAPLAEVQRYVSDLRSVTQGRGSFSMEFDHYEQVPAHVADKVIEAAGSTAKRRTRSADRGRWTVDRLVPDYEAARYEEHAGS